MAGLLSKLFAPKIQHADPKVRLAAINATIDPSQLLQLAQFDEQQEVRLKALSFIHDKDALAKLASDKTPAIAQAAAEAWYSQTLGSADHAARLSAIQNLQSTSELSAIINMQSPQLNNSDELALAALAQMEDEEELLACLMASPSAKARLMAAEKIQDPDRLKSIEKAYKGRDKSLLKRVKQKLKEADQLQRQKQQALDKTQHCLQQLEQLSQQAFNPNFQGQLTHLKHNWQTCQYSEEQQGRFSQLLQVCEQTLSAHQQEQDAINLKQQAQDSAQRQRANTLQQLNDFFTQAKGNSKYSSTELTTLLKDSQQSWINSEQLAKAEKHEQQDYQALIKPLINLEQALLSLKELDQSKPLNEDSLSELSKQHKQLDKQLKKINWPNEFAAPKAISELQNALSHSQQAMTELKAKAKDHAQQLNHSLNKLQQALNDGQLKDAKQLHGQANRLAQKLERHQHKQAFDQLQALSKELHTLNDWQGFAAAPKFEALITQMQALNDSKLEPPQLATAIRDLQDQWKALGGLANKKQHNTLWQAFKQASDAAYQPVKAHQSQQKDQRQYNAQQRRIVCQHLTTFHEENDWANCNWKSVQVLIDKAYAEIKKFSPVERNEQDQLHKEFNAAISPIKDRLNQYYQANADDKQALIEQAQQLLQHDDLAAATERCKQLQQQWKTIANAGRHESKLWQSFRQACDQLFDKRQADYQAKRTQTDEQIAQANQLLSHGEQILATMAKDSEQQLQTLGEQLKALELPAKVAAAKVKQLQGLLSKLEQNKKAAAQVKRHQQLLDTLEVAERLAEKEIAQQSCGSILEDIKQKQLPAKFAQILTERIHQPSQASTEDHLLACLNLEIAMEQPSPEQDKAKRMEIQVKKLQQGFAGQKEDPQALLTHWLSLPACDASHQPYQQRFIALIKSN